MSPLEPGKKAPQIEGTTLDGSSFSLDQLRSDAPVLLAFFKVGCPTCQYAFPFLERIHRAYPGGKFKVIGVSQDDAAATKEFNQKYGVSFPVVLDDPKKYPASNAYGLKNVPSLFMVSTSGDVEQTSAGWVKEEFERMHRSLAMATGQTPAAIFKPGESVQDFKAG